MRTLMLGLLLASCGVTRAETRAEPDDGDVVEGAADLCPEVPEDPDAFEDEDGCPEADDDGDGHLDLDDLCPREVEDVDTFQDEDGCPDPDNDEDRILDVADACPDAPEVYNGSQDEDGCPDEGHCLPYGLSVTIEPVIFRRGVQLTPAALEALERVAERLWSPAARLVAVSAYADPERPHTLSIADARLERVRAVLVAHGFPPERLVIQRLDRSLSDQPDALQRVDLTVLCGGGDEFVRAPDGHAERVCPTGRCDGLL